MWEFFDLDVVFIRDAILGWSTVLKAGYPKILLNLENLGLCFFDWKLIFKHWGVSLVFYLVFFVATSKLEK